MKGRLRVLPWRLMALGFINLLLIAFGIYLYLHSGNSFFLLAFALVLLAIDFFGFYQPKKGTGKGELQDDFVRLFTYFGIYMECGYPVYTALREGRKYASPLLSGMVDTLLSEIDADKSLAPYLKFAAVFDSVAIRQVMVAVYQMVEEGYNGNYVYQFQTLFSALSAQRRREATLREEKRLEALCVFPLVGSAVSLTMVALAIVNLVGGFISGI